MATQKSRGEATTLPSSKNRSNLPPINLVVLGKRGVGKSSFVQNVLGRKDPASACSSKKMSMEGVIYQVRLFEVDLEDLTITPGNQIVFGGKSVPSSIDGLLLLYDVTSKASTVGLADVLNAASSIALPSVLVSSKCDYPRHMRRVGDDFVEELARRVGHIRPHQVSFTSPDDQKRCISVVLKQIALRNAELARQSRTSASPRRRAATSTSAQRRSPPRTVSHSRANSELTVTQHHHDRARTPTTGRYDDSRSQGLSPSSPSSSNARAGDANRRDSRLQHHGLASSNSATNPYATDASDFLRLETPLPFEKDTTGPAIGLEEVTSDMDDGDEFSATAGDGLREKPSDRSLAEAGFTFDELVDRLLSQPMSKQDAKFAAIFLCLYRKFALPSQLLSSMISRFDALDKNGGAQLYKMTDQMRLVTILAQWVSEYPGDFAKPAIRKRMTTFVARLEKSRVFSFAAKEINASLDCAVEDDDTGWAIPKSDEEDSDDEDEDDESILDEKESSLFNSTTSLSKSLSSMEIREEVHEIYPRNSSTASQSTARSKSLSTLSLTTLLTLESAQRESAKFPHIPRFPMTKDLWRQFMEIPDDDFAKELTRIDWIMYCSIRPRDLVRYSSLSKEDKAKTSSLSHVKKMVDHFNHVASFVSNMILLRDKPKHRAKAMEKFMGIARQLRKQNNYNSVGSISAGLSSTSVHRLAQTRDQVPASVQKDFLQLVILMSTQRSHFAYRLAWENSFGERIPFIPLHVRDLSTAEEGNKTFLAPDRINWKKFEIMGEVVVGIQQSQGTPYPYMTKNEEVMKMVMETKIVTDEDELYDKSTSLEAVGAGEGGRRMFNFWR